MLGLCCLVSFVIYSSAPSLRYHGWAAGILRVVRTLEASQRIVTQSMSRLLCSEQQVIRSLALFCLMKISACAHAATVDCGLGNCRHDRCQLKVPSKAIDGHFGRPWIA